MDERVESIRLEQNRLRGLTGKNVHAWTLDDVAYLLSKLDAAEKERDRLREALVEMIGTHGEVCDNYPCEGLTRAKAALASQGPKCSHDIGNNWQSSEGGCAKEFYPKCPYCPAQEGLGT